MKILHIFLILILINLAQILAGNNNVYAQNHTAQSHISGLYIGVEAGGRYNSTTIESYSMSPGDRNRANALGSISDDRNFSNLVISGLIGYRFIIANSSIFLAPQFKITYEKIDEEFYLDNKLIANSVTESKHKVLITQDFIVNPSILIGTIINSRFLFYGELGLTYNNINLSVNPRPTSTLDSDVGSVHDWVGYNIGVGTEFYLNKEWSFRTAYQIGSYFLGPKYDNDGHNNMDTEITDHKWYNHTISVGLIFNF